MTSLIVLAEARKRVPSLPSNDTAAQQIIDEQEAWLARRLGGPLVGERTETFYVGGPFPFLNQQMLDVYPYDPMRHRLSLLRYTDSVVVEDNGDTVDAGDYRLQSQGSAISLSASLLPRWWRGPYVDATYTPNDETEVKRVLYQLIAWEADPPTVLQGERIGSYSYTQSTSLTGIKPQYARNALAGELIPKRDPLTSLLSLARHVGRESYVINLPEPIY
jgi:hypothetical protein